MARIVRPPLERPATLRQVPTDVVGQGRAWPSPRTWDRAHVVAAAADAAGAGRDVIRLLVAGLLVVSEIHLRRVGTIPGTQQLRHGYRNIRLRPNSVHDTYAWFVGGLGSQGQTAHGITQPHQRD